MFRTDLDHWGTSSKIDPFRMAIVPMTMSYSQLCTILKIFETLDDLVAISPRELGSIKGIGRRTVETICLNLYARGLSMRVTV